MKTPKQVKLTELPPLKTLVYFLTLCGFSSSALANTFPTTPLHLQDNTITAPPPGVKPNIMLFIDDSGSMAWNLNNSNTPAGSADNRMFVVQKALNDVLNKYTNQMNWGLQTLHNNRRGTLNTSSSHRDATLKSWFGLAPSTAMNCQSGTYAITSANYINYATMTAKDNQRLHFTDNHETIRRHLACLSPNGGTPTTTRYNAITKLMHEQANNLKNRCQKSYIVVLSDGDADSGQGQLSTSSTNVFKDLKTSGTDAYGVSWQDPEHPVQNIVTYTVGFGSGLSNSGRKYLTDGASKCEGEHCKSDKHFYNAVESKDLVDAFDQIFTDITTNNQSPEQKVYSATAPAISSNYVDGMAAAATLNTGSWSSELLFYDVDANGRLDTANPKRANFNNGNRQVLISNGTDVNLYSTGLNTSNGTSRHNNWYDIPNVNTQSTNPNRNEWRDGLLKWMARADTDKNIANQKTGDAKFQLDYRERPTATVESPIDQRSMGDIIDNSILAIGNIDRQTNRQEFIVTSTNDGMVYVFQAQNNNTNPYALKFNYVPSKMERHSNDGSDYVGKYYKDATRKDYGRDNATNPHRYLLNGGMVARSTDTGGMGKQVFVASSMGQAARGAFAFNVGGVDRKTGLPIAASGMTTNNWHQDVKLFETPSGSANELGFTINTPQIGRVQYIENSDTTVKNNPENHIRYGVFVSNGYNYSSNYGATTVSYNDTPALYIYEGLGQDVGLVESSSNYTPGTLLKKITIPGATGGLATPTLVDVNFDGVIDYAYAGDYTGGLYRFNLSNPNPNTWNATKIFQTQNNRPITSAPAVYRNSMNKYTVIVGTGSEIYQEDLASKDRQSLYGIFDDVTLQDHTALVPNSALLEQTLTSRAITLSNGEASEVREATNHPITENHRGWFVQLDANNGERITVKPSIMGNSILLSTRVYEQTIIGNINNNNTDPCLKQVARESSSAYSWLMQFNTSNGGLIPANRNSVYIDYNLGDNARFTLNNGSAAQSYMISGQKLNHLTSITFIDRLMEGYSSTTSGDSGGSGEDVALNRNPIVPKNTCVGEGSKAFTFDTGGNSETYQVYGACQNNMFAYKRVSWREIF